MKKLCIRLLSILVLFILPISFSAAAQTPSAVEAIVGSANNLLIENFSQPDVFDGKVFLKNDTAKTIPGWGMIAESSEISGTDVSNLGEKAYYIPLAADDLQKDIGIKIKATPEATKIAYLDVWNIPIANISGADRYRFEYNLYVNLSESVKSGELLSEFRFYTSDVPGATKSVGVIGLKRDGTMVICTNSSKNTYAPIKDESGTSYTFENKTWQHIVLDFDAAQNTFDFTLNGNKLVEQQPLSDPILWNAESGTYRVRLSFDPLAEDTETFVVFDDILFGKYTDQSAAPAFSSLTTKSGITSQSAVDFSSETNKIAFTSSQAIPDTSVSVLKNGTTPVAFQGTYENGIYTLTLSENVDPLTPYTVTFDRWTSTDEKIVSTEPTTFSFYSRNGKAVVSDFAFMKAGTAISALSEADATTAATASVFSAQGTDAILIVSQYDADGTMIGAWSSAKQTIAAGATETLTVSLDGYTPSAGGELKAIVWESLDTALPLWNYISIQ